MPNIASSLLLSIISGGFSPGHKGFHYTALSQSMYPIPFPVFPGWVFNWKEEKQHIQSPGRSGGKGELSTKRLIHGIRTLGWPLHTLARF